jgi:hypothetical protein
MSSIKVPNARKEVEVAYDRMMTAYDNYQTIGGENFKRYYEARLNDYRDLCTVIVERLIRENPRILEDMTLPWLT